jgi:FkbM family methyltransferase
MISYTRNFEDVILVRALGCIQQGFYVDVGASHPVGDSNTYALYGMGWRGIAIEPQPIFNADWQQHRPQDILVNAAIAHGQGEVTLYKPVEYGQAATINADFAKDYERRGIAMSAYPVAVHTLADVLGQLRPEGAIHLLSIDVEGAEAAVLAGMDWARFRPWLVVIESTMPGVPTHNYAQWEPYLLAQRYEFAYFDGVNRFYVAAEHAELKAHFNLPPNVWDDFTSHELSHTKDALQSQTERLKTMTDWMTLSAERFKQHGDLVASETLLRRMFELVPTYQDAYWPLGALLTGQGRRAEALAFYEATLLHAPDNFYSHHNIAMLLRWEKRFEESEAAFLRMMAINPSFSEGRMNYGALLLALGRYSEGWALFESRYVVYEGETPRMSHNAPYARWLGEPLAGKSIMLMREQGYGDEIMFARFAKDLKERGAAKVSVLCQAPIKTLLATVPGVDEVLSVEDMNDVWPPMDFWIFGQSLPHVLGVTLDNLPANIPYIAPQAKSSMAWRARIQQELSDKTLKVGTIKVGVSWRGSPTHGNDHHRSLSSLPVLRPLWDVPNVSFVSLQTGDASVEALNMPPEQPIAEWGSQLVDFADGAALVSQLDLVISVDTAIVHIAGALGVPCFVMIPRVETDWRWLNDRDDSPWYPKGMRIFRQTTDSGWDDVVAQLKDALQALSSMASSSAKVGN